MSASLDDTICLARSSEKSKPTQNNNKQLSYNKNNINLDNFKSAKRKVPTKNLSKLSSQLNQLEIQTMKERIAQAEVFLEAMGCASMVRNRDSSRYVSCAVIREMSRDDDDDWWCCVILQGKYFDLEIDYRGDLIGGHIMHCKYLFAKELFM